MTEPMESPGALNTITQYKKWQKGIVDFCSNSWFFVQQMCDFCSTSKLLLAFLNYELIRDF